MVFKYTGINAWFALVATDEMFAEKKFGRGNGNEDMAIAIGELNIERACGSCLQQGDEAPCHTTRRGWKLHQAQSRRTCKETTYRAQ